VRVTVSSPSKARAPAPAVIKPLLSVTPCLAIFRWRVRPLRLKLNTVEGFGEKHSETEV
jgi:hypothetical protein